MSMGYLGRHDPIIREPLRDIGLCPWWGFSVADVDCPAVYPVLLSGTLWDKRDVVIVWS